jgi:hypothetical protein
MNGCTISPSFGATIINDYELDLLASFIPSKRKKFFLFTLLLLLSSVLKFRFFILPLNKKLTAHAFLYRNIGMERCFHELDFVSNPIPDRLRPKL